MQSAATLVHEARHEAGLSCRALAQRAGVSATTITRIEAGAIDPTLTTLQRVVAAAGRELTTQASDLPDGPSISRLANPGAKHEGFKWNELRAFIDWERRHPETVEATIGTPPPRTDTPLDALLAGIAEKLADDASIPRPRWCARVPALAIGWMPPGTPRMIARAREHAPEQLKRRNIFIAEEDLWRHLG